MRPTALTSPVFPIPTTIVEKMSGTISILIRLMNAREKLGRSAPIGEVDPAILNRYGGSIAIGHPFGATGARIVTTLSRELERSGVQFGLLTVCAAGALGHAMVLERA